MPIACERKQFNREQCLRGKNTLSPRRGWKVNPSLGTKVDQVFHEIMHSSAKGDIVKNMAKTKWLEQCFERQHVSFIMVKQMWKTEVLDIVNKLAYFKCAIVWKHTFRLRRIGIAKHTKTSRFTTTSPFSAVFSVWLIVGMVSWSAGACFDLFLVFFLSEVNELSPDEPECSRQSWLALEMVVWAGKVLEEEGWWANIFASIFRLE